MSDTDRDKTEIIYKGQLMKDMDELRGEAKMDICDHYCKYGTKADGEEYDEMIDTVCADCPLAYL